MDAAVKNFVENGVTETSIADIMKEARLGVGTFYNYFESKEALLFCLLKEIAEAVCGQAEKSMENGESAGKILRTAVKSTTEALEKNPYVLPLFLGTASRQPNDKNK
jgi:AcrR family transcriptional regulator